MGIFQKLKQKIVIGSVKDGAERGDFRSQYYLAMAYATGTSTQLNYEEAYFWYSIADRNIPADLEASEAESLRKYIGEGLQKAVENLTREQMAAIDERVAKWTPKIG